MKTNKIIIPEGWEIDKVENGEIILKETKKELPKTWKECYKRLGKGEYIDACSKINISPRNDPYGHNHNTLPAGLGKPILALCQLLVCREVYRNGWTPDWNDESTKYLIGCCDNKLYPLYNHNISSILSFQSIEIRDKFLENFRDLIEEAKELI